MHRSAVCFVFSSFAIATMQLQGCAGTSAPQLLTTASLGTSSQHGHLVQGKSVPVYTRIARGAKLCWFRPERPLALSHRFHATVSSAQKTGAVASIVIYQRRTRKKLRGTSKPRSGSTAAGTKAPAAGQRAAMRISIERASNTQSKISIVNRLFPIADAARMSSEIQTWASGKLECSDTPPAAPAAANPDQATKTTAKPIKAKRSKKKR